MSVKDIVLAAAGSGGSAENDPYFANTTLLLQGDVSNPDLSYTAFSDASTNNVTVTPVNGAIGSSFSPYNTSWGNYFDGASDFLSLGASTAFAFGTGNFTVEAWINSTNLTGDTFYRRVYMTDGPTGNAVGNFQITIAPTTGYTNAWDINTNLDLLGTSNVCDGKWHHIAVTRSGTTLRLFVDGVQQASTTYSTNVSPNGGSPRPYIGSYDGSLGDFDGYISNLRVVKGTAVYTSNFTPSASPLTAISGTSLLTCQSNRFIDNSSNAFAITVNGTPKITGASPFIDTDTTSGSQYSNATGWSTATHNASQNVGSSNFTMEFWVYPTTSANYQVALSKGYQSTNGTSIAFELMANYQMHCWLSSNGSSWDILNDQNLGQCVPYSWNHVVLCRSGNTLYSFVNGTRLVNSTNATYGTALYATTDKIYMGQWGSESGYIFPGYISDVRISAAAEYANAATCTVPTAPLSVTANTRFSALATRGAIYNLGFRDDSEYNHPITRVGNCAQGTFSPFSQEDGKWSVYFDGSNSYLTSPSSGQFTAAGNFTVSCWFFMPEAPPNYYVLGGNWSSGTSDEWLIQIANDRSIRFLTSAGSSFSSTGVIPLGQWNYFCATRSGSTVTVKINGSTIQSYTKTDTFGSASKSILIGAQPGNYWPFKGYISNFRLVSGAAITETPTTYSANISGTGLLTCQSYRFKDNSANNFSFTTTGSPSVQPFSPFAPSAAYDPDVNGGSVYFDGSGDQLVLPDSTAFDLGLNNKPFTMEFWMWLEDNSSYRGIIHKGGGTAGWNSTTGWQYVMTFVSGVLYHQWWNGSSYSQIAPIFLNYANYKSWVHIATSYDGTNYSMWFNGVRVGNTAATFVKPSSSGAPRIGNPNGITSEDYPMFGYISGFRMVNGQSLYNPASASITVPTAPLTPSTNTSLLLNFTNAGVIDATGRNVIESVGGARVDTSVKKYGSGSLLFNGSGDELVVPWSEFWTIGSKDYTIEFWLNTTDGLADIISAFNTASPYPGWLVGTGFGGNTNKLVFYHANSSTSGFVATTASVNDGTWKYIAVTKAGSTLRFYINGVLDSSHALGFVSTGSGQPIRIARDNNTSPGRYFGGSLDDLRITSGVARYTGSTHTVPTKSLPNQ